MAKPPKTVAESPRRRVSVGRKKAEPEVSFDTRVAIDQAIAALDLEEIRTIVLSQEAQLNALRCIVFDFQTILRQECGKRSLPVTKDRFHTFVANLRKTIELNARDLAVAHTNVDEVNEEMPSISDEEVDDVITQTFGPLSDWRHVVPQPDDPIEDDDVAAMFENDPIEADEMAEMLENAAAETDNSDPVVRPVRTPRRRARPRPESEDR